MVMVVIVSITIAIAWHYDNPGAVPVSAIVTVMVMVVVMMVTTVVLRRAKTTRVGRLIDGSQFFHGVGNGVEQISKRIDP